VIAPKKILKGADVWLMSARWWIDLQGKNLFKRYNFVWCPCTTHGYHRGTFGLETFKSVILYVNFMKSEARENRHITTASTRTGNSAAFHFQPVARGFPLPLRDKIQVIQNMARLVKSGKKVAVSDVITKGEIPKELHTPLLYACFLAGAQPLKETMDIFIKAGLKKVVGYELTADIKDPWKEELPVLYHEVMNAFKDAIRLGVYEPKDESELDRMAERLLSEKFGYAIVSGIVL